MAYLSGDCVTWKDKHRLHDRMNALCIAVSSFGIAGNYLVEGKAIFPMGTAARFECARANMEALIPINGPLEGAIAGRIPDRLVIKFVPLKRPQHRVYTDKLVPIMTYILGTIFGDFFEAYREWLDNNVSSDPYKWPPVWNFARVVRNALSHGGKIEIRGKNPPPVTWHGLTYSKVDDGKVLLFNGLAGGDIIALMFEMNDELDKLGCPIL